jgi:epoxyqueuosine reductase
MEPAILTQQLKSKAHQLGFSLTGACPAVTVPGAARLDAWLDAGFAGEMHYIADRRDAYDHPRGVLDSVQSLLMLAIDYGTLQPVDPPNGSGRLSRYAWGSTDYHHLIRNRLNELVGHFQDLCPQAVTRGVVDTAPLMERDFAELAGLGWVGKNTLLLNRVRGSWFFLAALLTDQELVYDAPQATDHCGTCRACLDACPTQAFPQPYVLDASRCISYLTIELKHSIPVELRRGVGQWVFGCDVCQEVCPWNSKSMPTSEPAFKPLVDHNPLALIPLFSLSDQEFRARFRDTPLWRPRRRGLLRNAAIVLGNHPLPEAIPALLKGLVDQEPLIRGAAAWALGNYCEGEVISDLNRRRKIEEDTEVCGEIDAALLQLAERRVPDP